MAVLYVWSNLYGGMHSILNKDCVCITSVLTMTSDSAFPLATADTEIKFMTDGVLLKEVEQVRINGSYLFFFLVLSGC